jgi:hypothetical protein
MFVLMKKFSLVFITLTFFYNVLGYYVLFVEKKQQTWVTSMEKVENSKYESPPTKPFFQTPLI